MYKRTSTPARKDVSAEKYRMRSKQIQTDELLESHANVTQFNHALNHGKNMNDDEFEEFIKGNHLFLNVSTTIF